MNHFNSLSPAEHERLSLLLEECGEVIQAIGKILRHGYDSVHPDGGPDNRDELEREIGDVLHAVDRMIKAGDVTQKEVIMWRDIKARKVAQYLHHQTTTTRLEREGE